MPVFNAQPFLRAAIDSVLSQTFHDFEFVIINDGSTDGSDGVLREYAARDARVHVLSNDITIGPGRSRNRGISQCRGDYVACMDADDVSLPERFRLQVQFMDAHQDIGVCGTWFKTFGDTQERTYRHPETDADLKSYHLLRNSGICSPSAFIRRSVLQSTGITYPNDDLPSGDYWLWIRLGFVTKLANIPEVLLLYRVHAAQISSARRMAQRDRAAEAQLFFASTILGRPLTDTETAAHAVLSGRAIIEDRAELECVEAYGASLLEANAISGAIDQARLAAAIARRLDRVPREYAERSYKYSQSYDLPLLVDFLRDPLRPVYNLAGGDVLRFAFKCLVRHVPHL